MTLHDYQGHYTVIGPPGCGKTRWIKVQVETICRKLAPLCGIDKRLPVMICSLTRAAATEAAGRVAGTIPKKACGTIHSHCFHALGRPTLFTGTLIRDFNSSQPHYDLSVTDRTTDDTGEPVRRTESDVACEEYHLLRQRCQPRSEWTAFSRAMHFASVYDAWKENANVYDFTDLIEEALETVDVAPGNPYVILCDEAQDMSELEYRLLKKWGAAADAVIFVGDDRQSIYGFRGAHPELLNDPDVAKNRRRVLKQSYRVPDAVVRASTAWVAANLSTYREVAYLARKNARTGETVPGGVEHHPGHCDGPAAVVRDADVLAREGHTVMILAACGYMLDQTIAILRKRGIPFGNRWRRRNGRWNPLFAGAGKNTPRRLIDFLVASQELHGKSSRIWTNAEAHSWVDWCAAKGLLIRGAKKRLAEAAELAPDQPMRWADYFEPEPYMELLQIMDEKVWQVAVEWLAVRLLKTHAKKLAYPCRVIEARGVDALREEPRVTVGTIHSVKGGESDFVFLYPDISPGAARDWRRGNRDEIARQFYVGMTRAAEGLYLCRRSGSNAVSFADCNITETRTAAV